MSQEHMITTTEAARILGVSSRYVLKLCTQGELSGAEKCGRSWKIPERSVMEFNRERNVLSRQDELLPCGVGKSSYKELASTCYYVDKTLLIKEIIDDHNAVQLFARPRRFGKSLTISMLQTFFEKTEEDTSVYFRDRAIWREGERYVCQQGQFPVITLSFKDIKYSDWARTYEAIYQILCDEFNRHSEIRESELISELDKRYVKQLFEGKLTEVELSRALYQLTRALCQHYKTKVIILIDEYDTPIQEGYHNGYYEQVIEFIRNLFSAGLKDNEFLKQGVLTGILRVSKENLFSGLNNLAVNTVVDDKYSSYFGFTHDEVERMAEYYGKIDRMSELELWYDGYLFGQARLYNPWSVMNYFNNDCKPKTFWVNTSENSILQDVLGSLSPENAEELTELLEGKEVITPLNMEVIYPQIKKDIAGLYSFLLMCGYLKLVSPVDETEFGTFARVAIPNFEVRRVFETEVLSWIGKGTGNTAITNVGKALYSRDAVLLQNSIREFICQTVSFFDTSTEGFYHGLILGLTAVVGSQYVIKSNRESGTGRYDIAMYPKNKGFSGIIIEIKSTKDKNADLGELAEAALKQIEAKDYAADFQVQETESVTCFGIAFCGKETAVKSRVNK